MFVIYHGEVNSDSDGPVEICVPVSAGSSVDGVAMRQEPAHRGAAAGPDDEAADIAFPMR